MATMSAAPTSTATIPSSTLISHDALDGWEPSGPSGDKPSLHNDENATKQRTNGNLPNPYDYGFDPLPPSKKKSSSEHIPSVKGARSWDRSNRSSDASAKPFLHDDISSRRAGTGDKRTTSGAVPEIGEEEDSKWIHRDKLAKIESRELQAAGIVVPRSRASSRPRKGHSRERPTGPKRAHSASASAEGSESQDGNFPSSRHRKNSTVTENHITDTQYPSWDLRRPEEIEAEREGYWISSETLNGGSKIPVAKASPVPIPEVFLDRSSPASRTQSDAAGEHDSISYPKTRSRSGSANALNNPAHNSRRSATDVSPKKGTATGSRKTSAPVSKANGSANGRPKTRSGSNNSSNGTTRPSTRSGELGPTISNGSNNNKQPEGDPPWMVGSYKPDPRLPPDQQLLPTVAKRLQQEKWEKEGKFGNIYDKEFRPLTDDGLLRPPEPAASGASQDEEKQGQPDEWPLKPEQKSSSAIKQGTSYSTIPRISEKPPGSPLPSPLASSRPPTAQPQQASGQQTVTRVPEPPGEDAGKKKDGCGCCIIM
ncbi:hypothetical protein SODALDRAFT_141018 [Sodiomyces alkalinus F11]|uniref:TeaA receptor TeaR n=1 Tax=Sodiomyces alkalinus (strain CBS 110278 / VKM F-3762 / F11) TaxID=1314773 RepID=A0A3N2PZG4_SODAK|nr:hypothetical protein SODALDRAFT_141018 [Sodiomyces alkalinus F11]ROT39904.1 hypothetical protein SODALDRAFT_141018 [Sodiomyces alkalinus F11]